MRKKLKAEKNFPAPTYDSWTVVDEFVASHEPTATGVMIESNSVGSQYLLVSPAVFFPPGTYVVTVAVKLETGAVSVGLLSVVRRRWVTTVNSTNSAVVKLEFVVPFSGMFGKIVIAGCNNISSNIVRVECGRISIAYMPDALASFRQNIRALKASFTNIWQGTGKHVLALVELYRHQFLGRARLRLNFPFYKRRGRYVVIDSADVGYACRSIVPFNSPIGPPALIAASAGNDTLTKISIINGRLANSDKIKCPERSTPIFLSPVANEDGSSALIVSFFNFDLSGEINDQTCLAYLKDCQVLFEKGQIEQINEEAIVLLKRSGSCGYRGSAVTQETDGSISLAAVDRDHSIFHHLTGRVQAGEPIFKENSCQFDFQAEPIGIGVLPATNGKQHTYYLSLRATAEIVVIKISEDGAPSILQRMPILGLSRSSVAIGKFRGDASFQIAIAIWGGDPTDLNSVKRGKVVIGDLDQSGRIDNLSYFEAGVHPTDLIAGDFDGDGVDELAVLNYGAGLGPTDRVDAGGIDIFKYQGNAFTRIDEIKLANPRIAAAIDVDGDGIDELVVSLFFENKIAVIKHV